MTEQPPTLADAIAAVEYEIYAEIECGYEDQADLARTLASMRLVIATLQQHERLTADLTAANERIARLQGALREPPSEMVNYIRETAYRDGYMSLRPALKAAAEWMTQNLPPTPNTAGPQE